MFKILENIPKIMGWLQIAALPIIIGCGIGAFVYFSNPISLRLVIGLSIGFFGIVWATKIAKTKGGTVTFLSRVMATHELDNKEIEMKSKKDKF
ncbi:MAG: hypothetical protein HQ463_09975 [Bacteroidetes bacterium]|nr:hypothetical protein [Bacteroidota bacterium]